MNISNDIKKIIVKYCICKDYIPRKIKDNIFKNIYDISSFENEISLECSDNFVVDIIFKKIDIKNILISNEKIFSLLKNSNNRLVKILLEKIKIFGTRTCDRILLSLSNNYNILVSEWLIDKLQSKKLICSEFYLCEREDDYTVDFLIKNPQYINYNYFLTNKNKKAIEWNIKTPELLNNDFSYNISLEGFKYCLEKNYEISDDFQILNEDFIVEWFIKNNHKIDYEFSLNENDKAVEWLLLNRKKINLSYAINNSNEKMVDYIIEKDKNEHFIKYNHYESLIISNKNIRMIEYVLETNYFIDYTVLSKNPSIYEDDEKKIKSIINYI